MLDRIWGELNLQFANYARGKGIEVLIIGGASYLVFALFSLNYAALLGLLVGFSVIVPYIGAALVTIPVVVVAYAQFGVTPDFYWVVGAYRDSGARWQCAGAAPLFRGGQLASGSHCDRSPVLWWSVGPMGCFFRYPSGDPRQCHFDCLALDRGAVPFLKTVKWVPHDVINIQ